MNLLAILMLAIMALVSCQEPAHQTINLSNMLPEQLQGLLKKDWKQQLTGEIKKKVAEFKKPSHQS